MAMVHAIRMGSRAECLEDFARTYGVAPPRGAVPQWWEEFEHWFLATSEALDGLAIQVRTEAFPYGEEPDAEPEGR